MRNIVTLRPKFGLFPKRGDEAVTFAPDATQTVSGPSGESPQIAGTRECLATHAAWSIRAVDVITELEAAIARYGAPEHIRSDDGPEFIA